MSNKEIVDKEITWKVLDDITVHGTITAPNDEVAHTAVVFLAGSGPTDRNWCSPYIPGANGTAKILAEELARLGYVTLRYDKLGSGPRVKENLPKFTGKISMQTFMEELSGGVEVFLEEKNVDGSRVFALTNSEGAVHATNYQLNSNHDRFKGLVLTGAPGRSIGDVSRTQFLGPSKSFPNGDILMKHYDAGISDFLAGRKIVIDPSLPKGMEPFFRSLENPTNLPFSRELWTYNLSEHISRIADPILVLIGKKDIQVDWRLDGEPLETALGHNARASFAYPENANHVLKHEETLREKLTPEYAVSHYNEQDTKLDKDAEKDIFDFLAANV